MRRKEEEGGGGGGGEKIEKWVSTDTQLVDDGEKQSKRFIV